MSTLKTFVDSGKVDEVISVGRPKHGWHLNFTLQGIEHFVASRRKMNEPRPFKTALTLFKQAQQLGVVVSVNTKG